MVIVFYIILLILKRKILLLDRKSGSRGGLSIKIKAEAKFNDRWWSKNNRRIKWNIFSSAAVQIFLEVYFIKGRILQWTRGRREPLLLSFNGTSDLECKFHYVCMIGWHLISLDKTKHTIYAMHNSTTLLLGILQQS